jgi:pSer/pThr/pTyr-binding forkhead associated (FHA) protein
MNSRVTVGRHQDNDIKLTDEKNSLSRWHCGFVSDQTGVWLEDYRSINGTSVNGMKISSPTALNTGDKISLGPFVFYFVKAKPNTILDS